MRYKAFLINEDRGKAISLEEAAEILKKNCKDAVKYAKTSNNQIYRGVYNNHQFRYIDPKKEKPRKSANTTNYYTLLIDNSKYWKSFPKRSQSLICSTTIERVYGYGNPYQVFPYDGAKIGVAPNADFWISFEDADLLSSFNDRIEMMMRRMNVNIKDKSYKNITDAFKLFDDRVKEQGIPKMKDRFVVDDMVKWFKYYTGNLLQTVTNLLEPSTNDFELKTIGDKLPKEREVWTDSKSIMVMVSPMATEKLMELV